MVERREPLHSPSMQRLYCTIFPAFKCKHGLRLRNATFMVRFCEWFAHFVIEKLANSWEMPLFVAYFINEPINSNIGFTVKVFKDCQDS